MRAFQFFVVKIIINSMHELQIVVESRQGQLSYLHLKLAVFQPLFFTIFIQKFEGFFT